ncbi:MAG: DNA polymerase III subunit delta [Clostridiales bacterium]|jgi:DNA polymerase-3 subunit delta|nr:DNA polymerase III subunit delta [Clostridiales bacterium]
MRELNHELKTGVFRKIYLFFGTESYLVKLYEGKMRAAASAGVPGAGVMNIDVFEGKSADLDAAAGALETLPFLSDRRLVIIKDAELFVAGRKEATEKMAELISDLPDTTIALFIEKQADKRLKLYKKVAELGKIVEFKQPSEKELCDWIARTLKAAGKSIAPADAARLMSVAGGDMEALRSEMEKLAAYKGDATEVTAVDIDAVCAKPLDLRIFELVGAVGRGNAQAALDIFNNLILMKESPLRVLSMLARQFRLILQCLAGAEAGMTQAEIASALGLRPFAVKDYASQGANFSLEALKTAMRNCLDADVDIKSGRMGDKLAVEVVIMKAIGLINPS